MDISINIIELMRKDCKICFFLCLLVHCSSIGKNENLELFKENLSMNHGRPVTTNLELSVIEQTIPHIGQNYIFSAKFN